MPYDITERGFPHLYIDEEKQRWFETLEHISKFDIPATYMAKTRLNKVYGITDIEEQQAVGWAYQARSHDIYLLYDITNYKPADNAKEIQKERYVSFMAELEKYKKGEIDIYTFRRFVLNQN